MGSSVTEPSVDRSRSTRTNGNASTHDEEVLREGRSLARELWSCRYWIALVGGLAGVATALHFALEPVLYSSTVVLYVADAADDIETERPLIPDRSPRLEQLLLAARSTGMLEHLIRTYELYAHYGVDTTQPLFHERMCARLADNISVRVMSPGALAITVSDRDRALAPRLANNLYEELQAMTERQAVDYSRRVAAFYRHLISATQEETDKQVADLLGLAGRMKKTLGGSGAESGTASTDRLDMKLSEAVAQLSTAHQDLQQLVKGLEVSTAMLQQENLPNILLIQRAMEDMRTRPWLSAFGAILSAAFIGCVLCTLVLILRFKHGQEFTAYFTEISWEGRPA